MKQVALKGAIKLTKDKFDIDQDINEQLEVIKNISNNLFSYLKEGMEVATPTVHAPFDSEPANETYPDAPSDQKITYKYGNDTNTGEDTASVGQKKFVKDLFAKLPSEEKAKYDKEVNAETMTWQYAKKHIDLFQEILSKDSNPAPF